MHAKTIASSFQQPWPSKDFVMMNDMMGMMSGMSWGMGLLGLLVIVLLILGVAALVKYLFSGK